MQTVTKTFNVYDFNELSDRAKDTAYYQWVSSADYDGNCNIDTLKEFERLFNVKAYDWQYNECMYNYRFRTSYDNGIDELSGERLYKFIINNYYKYLFKPKTYYSEDYNKSRKSRISIQKNSMLAGLYADDEILDPIYAFLKRPDKKTTFYGLINKCLDSFFDYCKKDYEWSISKERFDEECREMGHLFYENGEMYN